MSFAAIQWALEQPVRPALTKFCLVAMAECVNSESAEPVCWPSYAHLCQRTGMNTKTVEQAVYTLKQEGYIVDTGRRAGGTGKVVVYRLNTTESGGIQPGPQTPDANGTRPQNTTVFGGVVAPDVGSEIPPKTGANPPKFDGQSPQISREIPPKTGVVIRNGTRNGTRKEPGTGGAAAPLIPDVPESLVADWLKVRKEKRAGPVTETVVACLTREAAKAGMSVADAVRYCCEAAWQNFNAGFYAKREGSQPAVPQRKAGTSVHAGFSGKNYREGVSDDGTFN